MSTATPPPHLYAFMASTFTEVRNSPLVQRPQRGLLYHSQMLDELESIDEIITGKEGLNCL